MDNFIEEVDEELRRERYERLWQRYGRVLVSVVLLVVIGVAGTMGWRQYQANQRVEAGLQYVAALETISGGKTTDGIAALEALGRDGPAGYGDLARLQAAAALARQGNEAEAAKIYDAIAKDSGSDQLFRDLALLLYALNVADRAEPAALAARLKPLTEAASPWRFSALEITALLHRRSGDTAAAKAVYQQLADDNAAPPQLRARAAEFLDLIGK